MRKMLKAGNELIELVSCIIEREVTFECKNSKKITSRGDIYADRMKKCRENGHLAKDSTGGQQCMLSKERGVQTTGMFQMVASVWHLGRS